MHAMQRFDLLVIRIQIACAIETVAESFIEV